MENVFENANNLSSLADNDDKLKAIDNLIIIYTNYLQDKEREKVIKDREAYMAQRKEELEIIEKYLPVFEKHIIDIEFLCPKCKHKCTINSLGKYACNTIYCAYKRTMGVDKSRCIRKIIYDKTN